MEKKNKYYLIGFAIISGLIALCNNSVLLITPLRMSDLGLSYSSIGWTMSAMAIGMLFVKLFVGRHSDIIGPKIYIVLSLFGQGVTMICLAYATTLNYYIVLLCSAGFFRGVFTSVNISYALDLASEDNYGKTYGTLLGISSLFACFGGMLSGFLYKYNQGKFALIAFGIALMIAFVLSFFVIPKKKIKHNQYEAFRLKTLLKCTNKYIYIFCIIAFLQTFATNPLWNFIIPTYCYSMLALSSSSVGVLMSLDELISSPTYIVVSRFIDKIKTAYFNIIFILLTGISGIALILSRSVIVFIIFFLMCSITISCTFVGIPKERIRYMRMQDKGFQLALFSTSGILGDAVGSNVLGRIAEDISVQYSIIIFTVCYFLIAGLMLYLVLDEKNA